ncbi:MAG TPA: type IV pilus modification protein PilV [Tahibacter sp.]|uniref:type IV pilus modification protein PilV n=1 Tax=Tahibacter sp. TaxID=2056211 RepID=UPI002C6C6620|nr:type IV pilus modification protein PilV [Tahibacter sp.]HSX60399.1 type IV pilus modification protein PilV [Tahibacter sp.]
MTRRLHRGFSLLEVMIALVIFSVGLMGMAGLLMVSVRTNHSSYLRSQAGFLAQSMADRMRLNMPALWANGYNLAYPIGGAVPGCGTGCTVNEIVTRDSVLWSRSLQQFLPSPTARINCALNAGATAPTASQIVNRAPYNGLCTITISWAEASLNAGAGVNNQTFAWVFQP